MSLEAGSVEVSLEMELVDGTGDGDFCILLSNGQDEKVLVGYQSDSSHFYVDRTNQGKLISHRNLQESIMLPEYSAIKK